MRKTERFSTLEEVHMLRLLLKSERDARAEDLRGHWDHITDTEFRRGLMFDAVADLFRSHRGNSSALGALATGVSAAGGWLPLIAPLLGGRKGLLGSRLFWTGLSLALPLLVNKDGAGRSGGVWNNVRNAIEQVKDLVHGHKGSEAEDP